MALQRFLPQSLILLSCLLLAIDGAKINRTIDDSFGDSVTGILPVYAPRASWEGNECHGCAIQPERSEAHDGTWMAATYNQNLGSMNISFSFVGIDLFVYFILANYQGDGITTETAVNFTLDNELVGTFHHIPTNATTLQYDALVFCTRGLKQTSHDFIISTSGNLPNLYVNFDYALYSLDDDADLSVSTQESPSTPESTSAPASTSTGNVAASNTSTATMSRSAETRAIVGGVVGGLAAITAVGFAIFFCIKGRQRSQHLPSINVDDNHQPPTVSPMTPYGDSVVSRTTRIIPPFATVSDCETTRSTGDTSFFTPSAFYDNEANDESGPVYPNLFLSNNAPNDNHSYQDVLSPLSGDRYVGPSRPFSDNAASLRSALPTGASMSILSTPEMRKRRQIALEQQMRQIQDEMALLAAQELGQGTSTEQYTTRGKYRSDVEMRELKTQMTAVKEQVRALSMQRYSPWVQGITNANEPPPGYSPSEGQPVQAPQKF